MSVVFNMTFTDNKPRKNANQSSRDDWQHERAFYDLTAPYNYVNYSLNSVKTAKNEEDLDYVGNGAFDMQGKIDSEKLDSIKKDLAKTKSIIWHGFISLDKDTSVAFPTTKEAIKFINATMSALFEQSHISTKNITMLASMHVDTQHRHIHFEFFEKEPKRLVNGVRSYSSKGTFDQKCIDNFMVSSGLYFEENKEDLHIARDKAITCLKELSPSCKSEFGLSRPMRDKLLELSAALPKTGRVQYSSKAIDFIRGKVDATVNAIIKSDARLERNVMEVYKAIAARREQADKIAKSNDILYVNNKRMTPAEVERLSQAEELDQFKASGIVGNSFRCVEKLEEDFKARLGNIVIGMALSATRGDMRNKKLKEHANDKSLRIRARKSRHGAEREIKKLMQIAQPLFSAIKANYMTDLHNAEREIEQTQNEYLGAK